MSKLGELPKEILLEVIKSLRYDNESTIESQKDLASLSLVSRLFSPLVQATLYESPFLAPATPHTQSTLALFLRSVLETPSLLSKILQIHMTVVFMTTDWTVQPGQGVEDILVNIKLASHRNQLGSLASRRLSELVLTKLTQWRRIILEHGREATWAAFLGALTNPRVASTVRLINHRGVIRHAQGNIEMDREGTALPLIRDIFTATGGVLTSRAPIHQHSICTPNYDPCSREELTYHYSEWDTTIWRGIPEFHTNLRITTWHVDYKKATFISNYNNVSDWGDYHPDQILTLDLLIQDDSRLILDTLVNTKGDQRGIKQRLRSFEFLSKHLHDLVPDLRNLAIRLQPDGTNHKVPQWVRHIVRANSFRNLSNLRTLNIPQDAIFKRFSKPGITKATPINRFLPPTVEHLKISYVTPRIMQWLHRPQICEGLETIDLYLEASVDEYDMEPAHVLWRDLAFRGISVKSHTMN